jgi:hypothetical protein
MTVSGAIPRGKWQLKAIKATKAHQSRLGAILLACLNLGRDKLPRFGTKAIVTSDGYILVDFWDKTGQYHHGAFAGDLQEMIDNFRGLADHLKLPDRDRWELFTAVRGWIVADYRTLEN